MSNKNPKKKKGTAKGSIKTLQTLLKKQGVYDGDIDGDFGPKTQEAYEMFQTQDEQGEGLMSSIINGMIPGKNLFGMAKNALPTHIKALVNDLTGDKELIDRESLSDSQLKRLQQIVRKNLGKGKTKIDYADYETDMLALNNGDTTGLGNNKLGMLDQMTDPSYTLKSTLGRAGIAVTPDNDTLVLDTYDFNDSEGEGNLSDLMDRVSKNPTAYGIARALGSEYGSKDGEGAAAIINTNEMKKDKKEEYAYGGTKKQKYAMGTGKNGVVTHYQKTPQETLFENEQAILRARETAENNGWVTGLNTFGALAMEKGMGMAGGVGGVATGIKDGFGGLFKGDGFKNGGMGGPIAALGGTAEDNLEVEVEGGEVAKLPDGGLVDFKGPSHEKGGVDVNLPEGTDIFSKRITVQGKTMAERESARTKKEHSLANLLGINPGDKVLTDTLKRTQSNNAMEQDKDKRLQETVKLIKGLTEQKPGVDGGKPQFGFGGKIFDALFKGKEGEEGSGGMLGSLTGGDILGMAGTLFSANKPMSLTEEARAGDTANINAFEDYGVQGLQTLEESKGYIGQQKDKALQDLESNRTRATISNRNTARGVNTLRALDLASESSAQNAKGDIYDDFSKQMMNLLGTQAGFENQQDSVVMQGEQGRDLADRQDRDNYYTQLAQDLSSKGQGIQQIGKQINENKFNRDSINALNDSSSNFKYVNGQLTDKSGAVFMTSAELSKAAKLGGHKTVAEYLKANNLQ